MKTYIDQIFYEGLGKTIYCPVENLINKLKSDGLKRVLTGIVKVLYFIIAMIIAGVIIYFRI